MQILKFDEFMRSLKQNMDMPHSILLGAGASVESGVLSASDCIWDWKREIFLSHNTTMIDSYSNTKIENVRIAIQKWLDEQGGYPALNSPKEYSFYAEKCLPIEDDRRKYFQRLLDGITPSLGYHLISMFSEIGWVKSVWTTNFDGLMVKCAHRYNLNPIEITTDSAKRIYRGETDRELLCIALHGDYKYGSLKNTANELDSQNNSLIEALRHELANRNLVVMGYSGRDKSLMSAIEIAYQSKGSGRLYWCGYGQNVNSEVEDLINKINAGDRSAFYIPSDGFDNAMYSIARHCLADNKNLIAQIETLKQDLCTVVERGISKFTPMRGIVNKIVKTNAFPIALPNTCYQLPVKYNKDENLWDYCKSLSESNIMAVPFKGVIYAWGTYDTISEVCAEKLVDKISQTSFTREELIEKGYFKYLTLKTIVKIIGQTHNLSYSKSKVWDTQKPFKRNIGGREIIAYQGVECALFFDRKFTYITLSPSFTYENAILTREERKQFANAFHMYVNNSKPNQNVEKYISDWANRILGQNGIQTSFPLDSKSVFQFTIRASTAILGINHSSNKKIRLPNAIDEKRIVLSGIECKDPELEFYNIYKNVRVTDFHPMRGLINNAPVDYSINANVLRSSISLGVICPQNHAKTFREFLCQLQNSHSVNYNTEFVIRFPGFYNAFQTMITIPDKNSNTWLNVDIPQSPDIRQASYDLGNSILRRLDQLSASHTDVAIIYIPKEFDFFTDFNDEHEKFDLHDFVKAYAVQKSIATQFIREKTLADGNMYCQIMWALSLAIYVKSCRIPWTISGIQKDTAFVGIGYSINHIEPESQIVVGCSHIYSADGQGMKYKLAKINDYTFDHKKNPYLTENEAYKLGLNIKELFYKSFTELPKRVVIHKRTPFRQEEIKGLKESLFNAGIVDLELLEIIYEDSLRCFAYDKDYYGADGFPVRRGLCYPINDSTMHLFTHGIAPSIRNPNHKYIQGSTTIPLSLRVVKHYGNGSLEQIATEILGLSKMNWNSFGLYSKLPCTIESSNEIARIGWLLSQYEGSMYDYRFFM